MKFIHTADIHLGVSPNAGKSYTAARADEIWDTFSRLIDVVQDEEAELLLIAGDLFHREPLMKELKEVSYLFDRIPDTKVVFTAGNHDYIRKHSSYLRFSWGDNVYPIFSNEIEDIEFPDLGLVVRGMSYHSKEISAPVFQNCMAPRKQPYKILMLHGGDEKHIPVDKYNLEKLGYDYVAMGHIHKPQSLIPGYAAYPGSLEPTDITDFGKHGFIRGEITGDEVDIEFVPFASRSYIKKTIEVYPEDAERQILNRISYMIDREGIENMYHIELTGSVDADLELNTELWDPYGNIIRIVDHTRKELDYHHLYQKNQDNLLGKYISSFSVNVEDDAFFREVREAGVLAILHAMEDKE